MVSTASGALLLFVIAWLATRSLSGAVQGFFFSFLSLAALLPLADFGLSYAALQTAGRLAGSGRFDEIPAVGRRVLLWNGNVCLIVGATALALGWATFRSGEHGSPGPIAWRGPWLAYVLASMWAQLLAPALAFREGSGRVREVWRVRLAQEWTAGLACIGVLVAGWGLWSLAAFAAGRGLVATIWFMVKAPRRLGDGTAAFSTKAWMAEVWPFQWRIGVSGLCGYLIFRAFPPLILLEQGPVVAGQFGLAISLMNLLISVGSAWPMSQTARYSAWLAAGRFAELRREFPRLLGFSTALVAAAAAGLALALWCAREVGLGFAFRLTDPTTTAIVLSAAVAHHTVICVAMFLRAEGREPLLAVSVVGGLGTVMAVWLVARHGAPRDIAVANLLSSLAGVLAAFCLLRSRERVWSTAEKARDGIGGPSDPAPGGRS